MEDRESLARAFEGFRPQLRSVAYRVLGSLDEADDAVQEAWLRLSDSDAESIENLGGWLTTVVARICLDMLRSRKARREQAGAETIGVEEADPEHEILLADSIGVAMLVVLDTLTPAERVCFVLHDMFAVPFAEIADIVGRSPDAAKMLASRARRRVQVNTQAHQADAARQRAVVEAFLAAARNGDFAALMALLDPNVVVRAELGKPRVLRGAQAVAKQALTFSRYTPNARLTVVNGATAIVAASILMTFTVVGEKVVAIRITALSGD